MCMQVSYPYFVKVETCVQILNSIGVYTVFPRFLLGPKICSFLTYNTIFTTSSLNVINRYSLQFTVGKKEEKHRVLITCKIGSSTH